MNFAGKRGKREAEVQFAKNNVAEVQFAKNNVAELYDFKTMNYLFA
jgi:hypothetical protein